MFKGSSVLNLAILIFCAVIFLFSVRTFALELSEPQTLKEPIIVKKWRVIGPFPMGVREAGTDPLAYFDAPKFENALLQGSFPSYLVPGAEARFTYAFSDDNGTVNVNFPDIPENNWELIKDEWGFAGTLYTGYAYGAFVIEGDKPICALIDLQGAGSFMLGKDTLSLEGVPWPGDSYGHNIWKQPVILEPGRHLVRVGFTYRGAFTFRLLPVDEPLLVIYNDITAPDIVRGEKPVKINIGVPLVNCTQHWVQLERVRIQGPSIFKAVNFESFPIAPFSVQKIVAELGLDPQADTEKLTENTLEITIQLEHTLGKSLIKIPLRIREPSQSRKEVYISKIDGSVQYYALLPPANLSSNKKYGLILSLHGAGVEAEGQIDNYQPKDWAYVVAATNRRRFGFDWQDWGRLDTLQVLEEVQKRYPIDENRIHLTGHSMGGHGTWYLGFTYPDKWATIAPSAGWTNFPLYVPTFLRRNLTLGAPQANLIWELALREDNTLALVENALNLPVYALEGGADDNVPPQQPRMIVELLRRYNYNVTYDEIRGKGHWWDDTPDLPGTDCVDGFGFNKFWLENKREPLPKRVIFRTHNLSINNSAYWIRILNPIRAYRDVRVEAEVVGRRALKIETTNVLALSLHLPEALIGGIKVIPESAVLEPSAISLTINGQSMKLKPDGDDDYYLICDSRGKWREANLDEVVVNFSKKHGLRYGPWKQAFMRPFLIVYGTKGTEEDTFWNLQLARFYAHSWWYRANGYSAIIADTSMTADVAENYNLILLGSSKTNHYTETIAQYLPIELMDDGVRVKVVSKQQGDYRDIVIPGRNLTVKYVYPNPMCPDNLILLQAGQNIEAFKRLFGFIEIYSGAGFPDWAIFGDDTKLLGLAGVEAMGFFNLEWEIDLGDNITYFREGVIRVHP